MLLGLGGDEEFSVTLVNAALLALWPALPVLVLSYIRQSVVARRTPPKFTLRKSELAELDRALLLYEQVRGRLTEIRKEAERPSGLWGLLLDRFADGVAPYADEVEDLEAHAQHLRAAIVRLSHRPLQRLRSWIHLKSLQFALGRALAAYAVGLALQIVAFRMFEQSALADELTTGVTGTLVWYPLDGRIFYANAVATGFAALTAPLFYLSRRLSLRREYKLEFTAFRDLAESDPREPVDDLQPEVLDDDISLLPESGKSESAWITVLGLSHAATINDVKEAYKALIKQNHPDRVHGMSPALRTLAERETKKINAAYRQALASVPSL
jgi:DnaJ domain